MPSLRDVCRTDGNWNVLPYVKGKTFELREQLAKRLSAAIHQRRPWTANL